MVAIATGLVMESTLIKDKSRAMRFHHRERMQLKAERVYSSIVKPENVKRLACRARDNMTVCSGPCCGNPRKWFGERTLQELRIDEPMSTD